MTKGPGKHLWQCLHNTYQVVFLVSKMHGPKVIVDMLAERGQTTLGRHQCIRVLSSWFSCHCAHWPCWWFFQVGCCAHAWHRHCGVPHWQDAIMTWSIKRIRAVVQGMYNCPSLQQDFQPLCNSKLAMLSNLATERWILSYPFKNPSYVHMNIYRSVVDFRILVDWSTKCFCHIENTMIHNDPDSGFLFTRVRAEKEKRNRSLGCSAKQWHPTYLPT